MNNTLVESLLEGRVEEFKNNLKSFFYNNFNTQNFPDYKFFPLFFDFLLASSSSCPIGEIHKFYTKDVLAYDSITYVLMPKLNKLAAYVITLTNYLQRDDNAKYEIIRERYKIANKDKIKVLPVCTAEEFRKGLLRQYNYDDSVNRPFIEILRDNFKGDSENIIKLLAQEACYRSSSTFFNEQFSDQFSAYETVTYVGIAVGMANDISDSRKNGIVIEVSRDPIEFLTNYNTQEFIYNLEKKEIFINNLISVRRTGTINQTNIESEFKIQHIKIGYLEPLFSERLIYNLIESHNVSALTIFKNRLEYFLAAYHEINLTRETSDTQTILHAAFYAWLFVKKEWQNWHFSALTNKFSADNYHSVALVSKNIEKEAALIFEIEDLSSKKNTCKDNIHIKNMFNQVIELRYGLDLEIFSNIKKVKLIGIKFTEKNLTIKYTTPLITLSQRIQTKTSKLLAKGKIKLSIENLKTCLNELTYPHIFESNPETISAFVLGMLGEWVLEDDMEAYVIARKENNFSFLINSREINKLLILTNIPQNSTELENNILSHFHSKIEEINLDKKKDEIVFLHVNTINWLNNKTMGNDFIISGHSYAVNSIRKSSEFPLIQIKRIFQNRNELISFRKLLDELAIKKFNVKNTELESKEKYLKYFIKELIKSGEFIVNTDKIDIFSYMGILGSASNNCDRYRIDIDLNNIKEGRFNLNFIPRIFRTRKEKNDLQITRILMFEFKLKNLLHESKKKNKSKESFWKVGEDSLIKNSFLISVFVSNRPIDTSVNIISDRVEHPTFYWHETSGDSEFLIDELENCVSSKPVKKDHACSDVIKKKYLIFRENFKHSVRMLTALNRHELGILEDAQNKIIDRWVQQGANQKTISRFREQILALSKKMSERFTDTSLVKEIIKQEYSLPDVQKQMGKEGLQKLIYFSLLYNTIDNFINLRHSGPFETLAIVNDFLETLNYGFGEPLLKYSSNTRNLSIILQKLSENPISKAMNVAVLVYQVVHSFSKIIIYHQGNIENYYWGTRGVQQLASFFSKGLYKVNIPFFVLDVFFSILNEIYMAEDKLDSYSRVLVLSKEERGVIFWESFFRSDLSYFDFGRGMNINLNNHYEAMRDILKENEELQAVVFYPYLFIHSKKTIFKRANYRVYNYKSVCHAEEKMEGYGISEFPVIQIEGIMNSDLSNLNISHILPTEYHYLGDRGKTTSCIQYYRSACDNEAKKRRRSVASLPLFGDHSLFEKMFCQLITGGYPQGNMCEKLQETLTDEKIRWVKKVVNASNVIPTISISDSEKGFAWNKIPLGNLTPHGKRCTTLSPLMTAEGKCNVDAIYAVCREAFYFLEKPSQPLVLVNINPLIENAKTILYLNAPYGPNKTLTLEGSLNNRGIFIIQSDPLQPEGNRVKYKGSQNYSNHFILNGRPYGIIDGGETDQDRIDSAHLALEKDLVVDFFNGKLTYFYQELEFVLAFSSIEQYLGNPNVSERIITDCDTRLVNGRGSTFNDFGDQIEINPLISCAPYHFELRIVNAGDIHFLSSSKRVSYYIDINDIHTTAYLVSSSVKEFEYLQKVFINTVLQNITIQTIENQNHLESTNGKGYAIIFNDNVIVVSNAYGNLIFKTQDYQFSIIETTFADTTDQLQNEIFYKTLKDLDPDFELDDLQELEKFSNDLQLVLTKYIIEEVDQEISSIINHIYHEYQKNPKTLPIRRFTIIDKTRSEIVVFGSPLRDMFIVDQSGMKYHLRGGEQKDCYTIFPSDSSSSVIDEVIINNEANLISDSQGEDLVDLSLFWHLDPIFRIFENNSYTILEVEYFNYLEDGSNRLLIHILNCEVHCQHLKFKIDNTEFLYHIDLGVKGLIPVKKLTETASNTTAFSEMNLGIDDGLLNETILEPVMEFEDTHIEDQSHELIYDLLSHEVQNSEVKQVVASEDSDSETPSLHSLFSKIYSCLNNFYCVTAFLASGSLIAVAGIIGRNLKRISAEFNRDNHQNQHLLPVSELIAGGVSVSLLRSTEAANTFSLHTNAKEEYAQVDILSEKNEQSSFTDEVNSDSLGLESMNSQLLFARWLMFFKFGELENKKLGHVCREFRKIQKEIEYESILYSIKLKEREYN